MMNGVVRRGPWEERGEHRLETDMAGVEEEAGAGFLAKHRR